MIKCLIVDDEPHSSATLQWQIREYCPELEILSICRNGFEALEAISSLCPQLVFLDVEMPGMSGFDLLRKLPEINFQIIFTTGYDHYAINAIRCGALDFLVKPVDKDELIQAVWKFSRKTNSEPMKQLEALLSNIRQSQGIADQKIALPALHGFELVLVREILYCESDDNYTHINLLDGRKILVSRTLKEFENFLSNPPFFRIHQSYLVNLHFATRYLKGEGGYLVLSGNIQLPVSRNKKESLLFLLRQMPG